LLVEAYEHASSSSFDFLSGPWRTSTANVLYRYLEGLRKGLPGEADAAGWRVTEDLLGALPPWAPSGERAAASRELFTPPKPYLLVPASTEEGLRAVRGVPVVVHGLPGSPLLNGDSRVERAPGAPDVIDLPTPLVTGAFDHDIVWVCRDPVDVLLLRAVGLSAVSLVSPCETLGSAERVGQFEELGVFTRRGRPRGTIVIVDPGKSLGARAGLLWGLFNEVWEAPAYTGQYLANVLQDESRPEHEYGSGAERLMRGVRRYGHSQRVPPVWLPPLPGGQDYTSGPQAPREPLAFERSTELAPTGEGGVRWVAEPFLARRAVTELYGDSKSGKSTFVFWMAVAIAEGREFLGRPCDKGPVLYISEQTRGMVEASMDGAGGRSDDVYVLSHEQLAGRSFPETAEYVLKQCQHLKARLVVFDTVSQVAGIQGDGENSAGVVGELYQTFRALSATDAAVLLVRHARKSGGRGPKAAAGSIAWGASADQVFEFVEPSGGGRDRVMTSWGRLTRNSTLRVRLTDDGYTVVEPKDGGGKPARVDRAPSARDLLRGVVARILGEGNGLAMNKHDVIAQWGPDDGPIPDERDVAKVLKALEEAGRATVVSGGVRNDPFRFRLCPPSPTGTSDGTK
jgi:hypothetical protein